MRIRHPYNIQNLPYPLSFDHFLGLVVYIDTALFYA